MSTPPPSVVNYEKLLWAPKKKAHRRLELQIPPPDVEVKQVFNTPLRPLHRCQGIDFTPYILRLNNNSKRNEEEDDRLAGKTQEKKKRLLENIISPPSPNHTYTCNKCFEKSFEHYDELSQVDNDYVPDLEFDFNDKLNLNNENCKWGPFDEAPLALFSPIICSTPKD